MKKGVLLDVSAMMYRAFYGNMKMKTKNKPTGAIYGFTNTLLSIINQLEPEYICAALDVKRSSLNRSKIYSEYKSKREAIPEDLLSQIPIIEEVLDYFGIKKFRIDGYEADDVLASLAKELVDKEVEIYIITGDKDLSQIVAPNIKIGLLGKGVGGELKILSSDEDVIEQVGVVPAVIPDLFGLIGDSSDGIPGVRKIGIKKAIPMLKKYENLEGIYNNLDKLMELPGIGNSIINCLVEDKEIAFLSRKLATICTLPIDVILEELKPKKDDEQLLKLFLKLDFKSLIKKMNLKKIADTIENSTSTNPQLGLFHYEDKNLSKKVGKVEILDEKNIIDRLFNEKQLAIYFENQGIAISTKDKDYYIELNTEKNKKYLQDIFKLNIEYISYGFKNILKQGYQIKNMKFDTMLAYHLLTSQTREEIEVMLSNVIDENVDYYSDIFGKKQPETLDKIEYAKYLVKRSRGIYNCYKELLKELKKNNLYDILKNIEMPLINVLTNMEIEGIMISPAYFKKYGESLDIRIEELKQDIYLEAGREFNINSPKQLGDILFIDMNIPSIKKTKRGYSTAVEVMENLKEQGFKIAEQILEFRKLTKLKSTYIEPFSKMVDENNRLHTTFNQTGTATGRLSSSDPNLQNIPVRTEEGMNIRKGFIAKEGYLLLGIDYSQIELRVLAEISGDENLIKAYDKKLDLHNLTAEKLFGINEKITREQRDAAKTINFSIIYGKTAFGLSKELKITPRDAAEYIDKYFQQYPSVKLLEKQIIDYAEEHGYVETYFKRKRIIDGINSKNKIIKHQAERMAVNTVIQGTAAEIIKKAMIDIDAFLKDKSDIKMLLQVHDELIFEADKKTILEYKDKIEKIMRDCVQFSKVKLEVNSSIGENWAKTK